MSIPYTETLHGEQLIRAAPNPRHEMICHRLHQYVNASVADLASVRMLPPRSQVRLSTDNVICPDLALLAAATGKLWLAAEVINSEDHRPDTVIKKQIYEDLRLPRLWIVDPRYDNAEVYHASAYGMVLKSILAGEEILMEKLLPEFQISINALFASRPATDKA